MLKIRFLKVGKKNQPVFRIVVTDKKNPPQAGRFLEILGNYNPITKHKNLKSERIKYWLSNGAQPSESVHNLLVREKIIKGEKIPVHSRKKKESPNKEEKKEEKKSEKKAEAKEDKEKKESKKEDKKEGESKKEAKEEPKKMPDSKSTEKGKKKSAKERGVEKEELQEEKETGKKEKPQKKEKKAKRQPADKKESN